MSMARNFNCNRLSKPDAIHDQPQVTTVQYMRHNSTGEVLHPQFLTLRKMLHAVDYAVTTVEKIVQDSEGSQHKHYQFFFRWPSKIILCGI